MSFLASLRSPVAAIVLALTLLLALNVYAPPAHADPVASVTAVVVTAEGVPISGARVRFHDRFGNDIYTDATGRFVIPLDPGQRYALDFVVPVGSGFMSIYGSVMTNSGGPDDLGAVQMPPLREHRVRVVDVDGTPVHQAYIGDGTVNSDQTLNSRGWLDKGAPMTSDGSMTAVNGMYFANAYTTAADGVATFLGPRIETSLIPAQAIYRSIPTGTVSRHLAGGSVGEGEVWTVALDNFRVGAPWEPRLTASPLSATSVRLAITDDLDGGSVITDHLISIEPGGRTLLLPADQRQPVISNLTPGVRYHFKVQATNAAGKTSDWSLTATAIPSAAPSAPSKPKVSVVKNRQKKPVRLVVRWAPAIDNGAVITRYRVVSNRGTFSATAATRTFVVDKPKAGKWTFRIVAVNKRGLSPASAPTTIRVRR